MTMIPLLLLTVWLACGGESRTPAGAAPDVTPVMDRIGESYVKLLLALEAHDPGHIVAYWGPASWPADVRFVPQSLSDIRFAALPLVAQLETLEVTGQEQLRRDYLLQQLQALTTRAEMLDGIALDFADEALLIYGVALPAYSEADNQAQLERIDALIARLPANGGALTAFERAHMVPADRLESVFNSVITEARRRTDAFMLLSAEDSVRIQAYRAAPEPVLTRYQGEAFSIIELSVAEPLPVGRVFDLAVRAAYPGHHMFALLRDERLARGRGWVEHTVIARHSPQWTMAEAIAAYGPELGFSREIRVAFQRDIIFPMAGLNASQAAAYDDVYALLPALDHLVLEAARRHLDGESSLDEAARWLAGRGRLAPEHARQQLQFAEANRGYVLGRSIGRELVRAHVQARGGASPTIERRWSLIQDLMASPVQPSGLVRAAAAGN